MVKENELSKIKLFLVGSCRNEEDQARVDNLRELAKSLNVSDKVDFNLNFSFDRLIKTLRESAVGFHSMINEHFGIGKLSLLFFIFSH